MKHINRRVILRKRNRLTALALEEKSEIIKEKLLNSTEYKKAKIVMFYVSFGSEVQTKEMIVEALKEKTVCVPVCHGNGIIPVVIKDIKNLDKKNKFCIPEPSNLEKMNKQKIDLVIVPGIVFDKNNHRIGYGKGYYDNFLKDFKGKTIGLALKMQILQVIPKDGWDIRLNRVISE
jgi:5-formyltetrahydrofolate cyclo-ligase